MAEQRSLLFIFAHPDDESFSAAGTASRYAEEGARLTLVTATRGDKGKCGDPPVCRPEKLARVREEELREAARVIGIPDVRVLDYRVLSVEAFRDARRGISFGAPRDDIFSGL